MQDFVHLHVHTQYSVLDGQASITALVNKAIKDGMKGLAVTDHGNMFGIKEFFNYVSKKNKTLKQEGKEPFKPIVGCEMYVARRSMDLREGKEDQNGYHLIVLAKNLTGYHNLIKLVSRAWTHGFYSKPRTDRHELEKYHEGLIVCSACLGGELPRLIIAEKLDEAEESLRWYHNLFGEDFYLELQRLPTTRPNANIEAYEKQQIVNPKLMEYARKYGIKVICTNDVHFVNEEDGVAHDHLICLSTNANMDDPKRLRYTMQEWMKTTAEMNRLFADIPEALANTVEICDKVEFYSIDHEPIMPQYDIPETFGTEEEYRRQYTEEDLFNEFTRDENGAEIVSKDEAQAKIASLGGYDKLYRLKLEGDYLAKLTFDKAKSVYGDSLSDDVKERLTFELHVMKTMGFPGYFLIVQDFIAAARRMGVSVGPGRGSAAGSAVAYCLGITQIDPIKYDLLFERFLNPDRISLPDIDIDFDDDGRGEVLQWVTEKYGAEKVAHIITYGTMAAKMSIKDVARVQKLPLAESDRLTRLVPDRIPDKKVNLANAIECVPELQQAETSPDPKVRDTIKYARLLEGNVRGTGVHACGIIICRDDITDWVPVSLADDKDTGQKIPVTQYEGSVIEETGLVKMDFLGLKTLSIIKETLENIRQRRGVKIDIDHIPLDDAATFRLYCEGKTIGTFQFESAGMQKYLIELQPSTFEDLIAMNALYRPGPMEYIPDFIERKQGRKPIAYDIPIMEKYLKDTYGITVYQEQVMLLSRLLADFTRGESDTLRKAMGKKQRDKLDALKPKFIAGGTAKGHNPAILEKIWGDWEKFASYAFNKSHATCYSWVAYQTAYLKANYLPEYMAAVLSRGSSNITEVTKFMAECKAMGVNVGGPDINESNMKFTVNHEGNIRFGLGAIKGIGEQAVSSIIKERETNGAFRSIFDFVERINLSVCNRKAFESLVLSGAFDMFSELTREQYFVPNNRGETFLDTLIRYGNKYQADKQMGQNSLFGGENLVAVATPDIPKAERWGVLDRLNREKEMIGIYLSAHPLDEFSLVLRHVCNTHTNELSDLQSLRNREITMGGMVTSVRNGFGKSGRPYGFVTIEDYTGPSELSLFNEDWINYQKYMQEGYLLFLHGKVQPRFGKESNGLELKITQVELLHEVSERAIKQFTICIPLLMLDKALITDLSMLTERTPDGETELRFHITDTEERYSLPLVSHKRKLAVGNALIAYIEQHPSLDFRIN
ncbi:MAG: DNA polymerase III subunit alpha [Prevotellaceae bacterium]|jgi:DNA polymerase-3 subunit alpha|nr:DNA polymerase III subunit alpha [Prevotellaceae bacterium]